MIEMNPTPPENLTLIAYSRKAAYNCLVWMAPDGSAFISKIMWGRKFARSFQWIPDCTAEEFALGNKMTLVNCESPPRNLPALLDRG